MLFFGVVLDGKNSFLFSQCGSDCHLCIQNSCVHQLFDQCRGVRNLNGILISKIGAYLRRQIPLRGLPGLGLSRLTSVEKAPPCLGAASLLWILHLSTLNLYLKVALLCVYVQIWAQTLFIKSSVSLVISKNYIPIVTLFCCLWEMVSS